MTSKKQKNKITLAAATSLVVATGVIAPLSSCTETQQGIMFEQLDKQYGVSETTYRKLKQDFESELKNKIKDKPQEEKDKIMADFVGTIESFDKAASSNTKGFTVLTGSMVNFARTQYGLKLGRQSSAKWSQLSEMFNGMAESMETYMLSNKLPKSYRNKIMADAKSRFQSITQNLKEKFGSDALSGILEAKKEILTCFEDVNDEIALISATTRLADFVDEYLVEYREDSNNNRLDQVQSKLTANEPIDDDMMNTLFVITKKSTGQPVDFNSDTMVPGFKLTPTLKEIKSDKVNNSHSLSIDFSLVKNYYLKKYTPEEQKAVTGHLYSVEPATDAIIYDDSATIADTIKKLPIQTIDFPVLISAKQEAANIKDVYFNKDAEYGSISFKWPEDHDQQGYESFFDGTTKTGGSVWKGTVDSQALSNAGLLISYNGNDYLPCSSVNAEIGKKNANDEVRKNSSFTLAEGFLNNCSFSSDVVITDNGDNHNTITHNFKVWYKNSTYSNDEASFTDIEVPSCQDYWLSKYFYDKTNQQFNKVYQFVSTYTNRELNLYEKDAKDNLIIQTTSMVVNVISVGILMWACWKPSSTPSAKKSNAICVLVALGILALQALNFTIFMLYYYNPIKSYNKKVDDFMKDFGDPDVKEMLNQIDEDKNNYFVILNSDGCFDDEAEYKAKSDKFRQLGQKGIEINRYYSTIMSSEPMQSFIDGQKKAGVDKDTMKREFSGWSAGGKYWLISWIITAITSIVALLLAGSKLRANAVEKNVSPIKTDDESTKATTALEELQHESTQKLDTLDKTFNEFMKKKRMQTSDSLDRITDFITKNNGRYPDFNDLVSMGVKFDIWSTAKKEWGELFEQFRKWYYKEHYEKDSKMGSFSDPCSLANWKEHEQKYKEIDKEMSEYWKVLQSFIKGK